MIVDVAPAGLNHVMFTSGGTDLGDRARHTDGACSHRAPEAAGGVPLLPRGDDHRDASHRRSSPLGHGHRRRRRRSLLGPYLYRSAFGSSTQSEECERALAHLEHVIALEGPSTIAALVLESVIGGSGVIPPPPGYLEGVRELCTKHGIVYIADEVMVGFGRTGEWFGVDHARVSPDLMAFAKGVNSGYVPLGGVLVGDPTIYDTFVQRPYPGGTDIRGASSRLCGGGRHATGDARRGTRRLGGTAWHGRPRTGPAHAG